MERLLRICLTVQAHRDPMALTLPSTPTPQSASWIMLTSFPPSPEKQSLTCVNHSCSDQSNNTVFVSWICITLFLTVYSKAFNLFVIFSTIMRCQGQRGLAFMSSESTVQAPGLFLLLFVIYCYFSKCWSHCISHFYTKRTLNWNIIRCTVEECTHPQRTRVFLCAPAAAGRSGLSELERSGSTPPPGTGTPAPWTRTHNTSGTPAGATRLMSSLLQTSHMTSN